MRADVQEHRNARDTTSQAVKQESKRKRGFCVKVFLVIIAWVTSREQQGEDTLWYTMVRSRRARSFSVAMENSPPRILVSPSVPRSMRIQNVIELSETFKRRRIGKSRLGNCQSLLR